MTREKDNMEGKQKTAGGKLSALLHLCPAVLVGILVSVSVSQSKLLLKEIPAKLIYEEPAPAEPQTAEKPMRRTPKKETPKTEEKIIVPSDAVYEDGVYTGSAQGYGGPITVQVTVANGKITDIQILEAAGETEPFFTHASTLVDTVLLAQTWKVDVISGATYSSRGILGAIQNALTGENVENEPAELPEPAEPAVAESFDEPAAYSDGVYTGSAAGFGGPIAVQVTIANGKITEIAILDASGETAEYFAQAKSVIPKILSSGSPNVDAVSGATYSSTGIINAVKRALSQAAASGNTEELQIEEKERKPDRKEETRKNGTQITADSKKYGEADPGPYTDGIYEGTGTGFGGGVKMQILVENGHITSVKILQAEDETPEYLNRAAALLPVVLEAQNTDVDVISGATFSSEGILDGIQEALSQAVKSGKEADPEEKDPEEKDPEEKEPEEKDPEEKDPEEKDPEEKDPEEKDPEEKDPQDEPVLPQRYADGSYEATILCTDEDVFAYEIHMTCEIVDGRIAEITAVLQNDISEDPESNETYFGYAVNGRTRRKVEYIGILQQIVDLANYETLEEDVDVVSGATYSSEAMKNGAVMMLEVAERLQTELAGEENILS